MYIASVEQCPHKKKRVSPSNTSLTTCLCLPHRVSIRLGDLECNAVTDPRCSARYQDFAIEQIIPHESYDVPKYANDIALIKLRETTETYNIISPLCLPTDQYAPYALNLTGQLGIIAGWGSTSNRKC